MTRAGFPTPTEALRAGADMLVIGRAVLAAPSPGGGGHVDHDQSSGTPGPLICGTPWRLASTKF